jgi:hypothetical protein
MFMQHNEEIRKDLKKAIVSNLRTYECTKCLLIKPSKSQRTDESNELLAKVLYCLQPAIRSGLHILNLDSDTNLAEEIFGSICEGNCIHRKL